MQPIQFCLANYFPEIFFLKKDESIEFEQNTHRKNVT